MNAAARDAIARRKALLAAHAQLERAQLALALHDIRTIVTPDRSVAGSRTRSRALAFASALAGLGVTLLGGHRLGTLIKTGSIVAAAWRILQGWRRPG